VTATTPATGAAPKRSRSVLFAAIAVGVLMLLLVVLLVTRKNAEDRPSASAVVGQQAPALTGDAVIGEPIDIGTNDRWLLVNFFATWCVPCVQEHPQLRKLSEDMQATGQLKVVSVVYDDKPADVREFFEERGGDWTVLDSDNGRTALDWGVAKVPESFLVAPNGTVVARFQGGVVASDVEEYIDQAGQPASEGGS
jgi:cytochrome c biogenesis protein CcmG, thiol:disulfide interchange protein DsbE